MEIIKGLVLKSLRRGYRDTACMNSEPNDETNVYGGWAVFGRSLGGVLWHIV